MGKGRHKILLLGYDLELLKKREAGLRKAGFDVDSVSSLQRALDLIQGNVYQLAIVGHAVGEQDRNRFAAALKLQAKVPVIFLYDESIRNASLAHAVLSVAAGIEALVAAANTLITGAYSTGCAM
jgi:DNA-binding response OmpR family regulator